MNAAPSLDEDTVWRRDFPDCDRFHTTGDLILVYRSQLVGNVNVVPDKLQAAMDFLKHVTCQNPRQHFGTRVVIGYTRKVVQPNWSGCKGNRIQLPWPKHPNTAKEVLSALSHELVHPFFRVSPLHYSNECWGEGFCDFLRGPVKNLMSLDGKGWWENKIEQAQSNKQDRGGNVAGQLVLRAIKEHGDVHDIKKCIARLIGDREAIRTFVNLLYDRFSHRPMGEEFRATQWIEKCRQSTLQAREK